MSILVVGACQALPSAPTPTTAAPLASSEAYVSPTASPTADETARLQALSTLQDLERRAVDLRAAIESGSGDAASTQVHVIAALVRDELEWWSAQPAAVSENAQLRAYHERLTALDGAATKLENKAATIEQFQEALSALLALRPVMDRGG